MRINLTVTDEFLERVEAFREHVGLSSLSSAVVALAAIGLDEWDLDCQVYFDLAQYKPRHGGMRPGAGRPAKNG